MARAAELIRAGRLVAFPTETVYGLGANALDPAAVERIFRVKGRPASSPLIVHVDSPAMARRLAAEWPPEAEVLSQHFWPGPLTLVLPKLSAVPDIVTAGLPTVGVRVPAHPLALRLIREAGVPIAAPSANPFTHLSPTTADHVREQLGGAVDLVLDGGAARVGLESTVLSLAASPPELLRPGMVSRAEIEALIGPVRLAARVENGTQSAPGRRRVHYSPRTPLVMSRPGKPLPAGRGVHLTRGGASTAAHRVEMPGDAEAFAAALYDTLHRLDRQGWDWIAIDEPPGSPEWDAIADRLWRASAVE
ncbi:MAG: threonylcarbamoyl-AMP synthase [Bryobacterales bacterium]|nr:threonylcarbamoyl-AMP synthase [Bryobacterales bacterium]